MIYKDNENKEEEILGEYLIFLLYKNHIKKINSLDEKIYKKLSWDLINQFLSKKFNREIIKKEILDVPNDSFYFKQYRYLNNEIEINKYIYHISTGGYGIILRINNSICFKIILDDYKHEYLIPHKIKDKCIETNSSDYLNFILLPKTMITNQSISGLEYSFVMHCILIYIIDIIINNKQIYLEKDRNLINEDLINLDKIEKIYLENFNRRRSNNINTTENNFKLFSNLYFRYIEQYTPIVIINNLKNFIKSMKKHSLIEYNKDKLKILYGNILILPLATCISTDLRLKKKGEDIEIDMVFGKKAIEIDKNIYRLLILQIFMVIGKLNSFEDFYFFHNDLKPDNILVFSNKEQIKIKYMDKTFLFKENYIFKISDFDFARIPFIQNKKINHSALRKFDNWFTDIHYFVHSLFYYEENLNKYDPILYEQLNSIFILPYCSSYKNSKQSHNKSIDHINTCKDFRYFGSQKPNISILHNFLLKSSLFESWRM